MPSNQPRKSGVRPLNVWLLFTALLLAACNLPQASPERTILTLTPTIEALPSAPPSPVATHTSPAPAHPTETPTAHSPGRAPGKAVPLPSGQKLTITRIDMIDLNQGWGETMIDEATWALLHTNDGGKTWAGANPPLGYPAGSRAFALDAQTLWAAPALTEPGQPIAFGLVYRTDDGGQTWQSSQPIPLATGEEALVESFFPSALFFLDADHGWLVVSVGHYMHQDVLVIFATQDGGNTWNRLTDKFQAGMDGASAALPCQALGIAFVTPQLGWLAGNCLAVGVDERWKALETQDGGKTWNPVELPAPTNAPEAVLAPQALCASEGARAYPPATVILDYRCLNYDQAGNTLTFAFTYASADGGGVWNGVELTAASFPDGQYGAALGPLTQEGARHLFVTANGGKTWNKIYPVTWPEAQLDFVDTVHGWAVARRWNDEQNRYDYGLVFTRDGGGVWEWLEATMQ